MRLTFRVPSAGLRSTIQALALLLLMPIAPSRAGAQTVPSVPSGPVAKTSPESQKSSSLDPRQDPNVLLEKRFIPNVIRDQRDLWTSPFRLNVKDAFWIVPSAALLAETFHRDRYLYEKLRPAGNVSTHARISDAGVLALGGTVAATYFLGRIKDSGHARETGILGAEALANSLAMNYTLKYALGRERPFAGNGRGGFFNAGAESFPSAHAMHAWAMASVIAQEYPGILTKIGVYGLASAVSFSRVTGRKHFPSDVLVGSALGWAIGRQVYRRHHSPLMPGEDIGTFLKEETAPTPASPYVPLDSWIYPAIERLAALGLVQSDFAGLRPWTRDECARLVHEASEVWYSSGEFDQHAFNLIEALQQEFGDQAGGAGRSEVRLESIYSRIMVVAGQPLDDGYHFGQTIANDEGRLVRRGFNAIAGFSGWASRGRWTAYVRGEFQHSPFAPALPAAAQMEISRVDAVPWVSGPSPAANRFRLLEAYVAYRLAEGWTVTAGKQSSWWAPNESGSLNFSNNAEPVLMVKVARVKPLGLPGLLHYLGPVRGEFFVGQLGGHVFARSNVASFGPGLSRQPLIDGAKLSFKPTPNLEYGISFTTLFGGPGFPLTLKSFLRTITFSNALPGTRNDPGDRRAGFDFRYRVPGLRKWLTIYNDSMTEDEISPIAYPRRSAMSPGIYMASVPGIPKLSLRAEGFYTDIPGLRPQGSYYFNARFQSGFTNQGRLLGHAVGRQGSGAHFKGTYMITPNRRVGLGMRQVAISPQYIRAGGHISDYFGELDWRFAQLELEGRVQWERWRIPVVSSLPERNVTTSFKITYRPKTK
jgi:membrane-associated phospholipid phosphatase